MSFTQGAAEKKFQRPLRLTLFTLRLIHQNDGAFNLNPASSGSPKSKFRF